MPPDLEHLQTIRAPAGEQQARNDSVGKLLELLAEPSTPSLLPSPPIRPVPIATNPVRHFTIANSHHPHHSVQARALHAYLRWRNANARHCDVLAAERNERARIRSEKGIRWEGRPSRRQPEPIRSRH